MKTQTHTTSPQSSTLNKLFKIGAFWAGAFVFTLSIVTVSYQTGQEIFRADLIQQESFLDPLESNVACTETDEILLKTAGGSNSKTWEFIGPGINGAYGSLTDGINTIDTIGETITTDEPALTYTGPKGSDIDELGTIFVRVTDNTLINFQTGDRQEVVFSLNITPSCIKNLTFINPDPTEINVARRGVPFEIKTIRAELYNDDSIDYQLPYQGINFGVTPESGGKFEENSFFTFLTAGKAFIKAIISGDSFGSPPNQVVQSSPLLLDIGQQDCKLTAQINQGFGGSFSEVTNSLTPAPIERFLRTGDTWTITVEGGQDQHIFTSTNEQVVRVEPLLLKPADQGVIVDDEGNEIPVAAGTDQDGIILTDIARIVATGPGVATITVTSRDGCTALLTVFVDIFPAEIRFAKLEGVSGLARGTSRNLLLEVEHKGGIENVSQIDVMLVKGRITSPRDIVNKEVFGVIDITQDVQVQSQQALADDESENDATPVVIDPQLSRFLKLYRIPIRIPELTGLTDGRYSLLITVADANAPSSGVLDNFTVLPVQVGAGIPGDLNKDNQVDIADVVFMFRFIAEKDQAPEEFNLQDLISLLRQVIQ